MYKLVSTSIPKKTEINAQYKLLCKNIKNQIRTSIYKYELDLAIKSKNNRRLLYAYVNQNKTIKESIRALTYENGITTIDRLKISEILNNQFFKVFSDQGSEEDFPIIPPLTTNICTIRNDRFTPYSIYTELKTLDSTKSPGSDGVHPIILNECATSICEVLSIIYLKSFDTGVVPEAWKRANISPIFKKGKKTDPSNYRPISLTAIPCKIIEKILKSAIMGHLFDNKLVSKNQHGFVRFKSCVTNLLETLDIITENLNLGYLIYLILLDFSKAFDLVSHAGFIVKLKYMGLDSKIINWIKSFLSNRKQRVVLGRIMSTWKEVLSGVPQGSVLGPLLFIIYINDMPELLFHLCRLFADDSKIIAIIKNAHDIERLQLDLDQLGNWAQLWKMRFNYDKCKVMYFGK